MKTIITIILSTLIASIAIAKATEVYVSATVPATFVCGIKGFDLVVQTNAQKYIINGKEIK